MHNQGGFSLLEVLVAGLVSALGLAGTAAMLAFSLAQTSAARDRTTAGMLAGEMAEIIRLAPSGRQAFVADQPQVTCQPGDNCAAGDFAATEALNWRRQVAAQLSGGRGIVCLDTTPHDGDAARPGCEGVGPMVIKVFWIDAGRNQTGRRLVRVAPP